MNPIIECKQIYFDYGTDQIHDTIPIFQGIDFSVKRGKIITIMGRSGCGKTTVLNILNKLLDIKSGELCIKAKRPVTIFQDKRLIPWETVGGNIRFGAGEMGIKIDDQQIEDMLFNVGLSPKIMHAYPNRLSGGMQQRVSLARALICEPDVLYMDEPFSALDRVTKTDLMHHIVNYVVHQGATVVFVTHDIEEACFLSDEIYEMRGFPAQIHKIMDIETPTDRRNDQTIQSLKDTVMKSIKHRNKAKFSKMAKCLSGQHVTEFLDHMKNRGWHMLHITDKEQDKCKTAPDCIIMAGNHPNALAFYKKYGDGVTRFLWLDTMPDGLECEVIKDQFESIKNWWGWENLYDDLIADAPNDKVTEVVIGHNWSFVETKNGAGLGRTPCRGTEGARTIPDAGDLIGQTIKELAQGLTSDDDLRRSLAIASLSAAYNPKAQGRTGETEWGFRLIKEGLGEKVCVGNFPPAKKLIPEIKIIEREPKEGHYSVAQGFTLLQQANYLVVTAQALMNGSLPRILFLAQEAEIVVMGPTAPLSRAWEKYGVRFVCGTQVTDAIAMRRFVSQAGTMLLQDHMAEKVTLEF